MASLAVPLACDEAIAPATERFYDGKVGGAVQLLAKVGDVGFDDVGVVLPVEVV
jgi:hypothetical protein